MYIIINRRYLSEIITISVSGAKLSPSKLRIVLLNSFFQSSGLYFSWRIWLYFSVCFIQGGCLTSSCVSVKVFEECSNIRWFSGFASSNPRLNSSSQIYDRKFKASVNLAHKIKIRFSICILKTVGVLERSKSFSAINFSALLNMWLT